MSWKKAKLSECCQSISDGDHQAPPKSNKGIPFVTISNIKDNSFDFTNCMHVPQSYYDNLLAKRKPQKGDILYSVVGSFGIPVLIKENVKFTFQRHIAILRPNPHIVEPAYMYYSMLSKAFFLQADAAAIGAAQRTISLSSLQNLTINLPDLPTQRRIASILSAYDDLIENNRRQIKLLEEAAQRLYREWFVELRFPGHEGVKVVDGVPEGWMKGTVDNIVKLLSGYPFKSSEYVSSGKYRLITIKNVKDGEFSPDNVDYIDQLPDKVPSHCILTEGDILLSLTGNIGRVCIVNGYNYLLNQRVAKLQTLHPAYAYCMFRSKEMLNKMTALSNGVAQQNLSPIRAEKIRILIPSSNLLSQFKNIVEPIISQIILLNNQITFACEARDRLLPELMDGEMEV
jgi:type I restriction enzyme S subunit